MDSRSNHAVTEVLQNLRALHETLEDLSITLRLGTLQQLVNERYSPSDVEDFRFRLKHYGSEIEAAMQNQERTDEPGAAEHWHLARRDAQIEVQVLRASEPLLAALIDTEQRLFPPAD